MELRFYLDNGSEINEAEWPNINTTIKATKVFIITKEKIWIKYE